MKKKKPNFKPIRISSRDNEWTSLVERYRKFMRDAALLYLKPKTEKEKPNFKSLRIPSYDKWIDAIQESLKQEGYGYNTIACPLCSMAGNCDDCICTLYMEELKPRNLDDYPCYTILRHRQWFARWRKRNFKPSFVRPALREMLAWVKTLKEN